MTDDWAAVATAINERMKELGWSQKELAERSGVSVATVRQIQNNTNNKKRTRPTLQSLSTALGWHPEHIEAVLHRRQPPSLEESETDQAAMAQWMETISGQLNAIQAALSELLRRLGRPPES